MPSQPTLADVHQHYLDEIAIIESAQRTQSPIADKRSPWFAFPQDDFGAVLSGLRDEVEERAYLAIVAATEAILQVDFKSRVRARRNTLLSRTARHLVKKRTEAGKRVEVKDILDRWKDAADAKRGPISEFLQLLTYRHWLAHGRYFKNTAGVPTDPEYAFARATACLDELVRLDPAFPRT